MKKRKFGRSLRDRAASANGMPAIVSAPAPSIRIVLRRSSFIILAHPFDLKAGKIA
jgi:hypothetical protein